MKCRVGCGACCIAPSISSSIPGMPNGKPAGVRCIQLTSDNRCQLFGSSNRPDICMKFKPSKEMCKKTSIEAISFLTFLEVATNTDK